MYAVVFIHELHDTSTMCTYMYVGIGITYLIIRSKLMAVQPIYSSMEKDCAL